MNSSSVIIPFISTWAIITVLWVLLLIYRGMIGRREENQLFLRRGDEAIGPEQQRLARRLNAVTPLVRWLGVLSLVLLVVVAGLWINVGMRAQNLYVYR